MTELTPEEEEMQRAALRRLKGKQDAQEIEERPEDVADETSTTE